MITDLKFRISGALAAKYGEKFPLGLEPLLDQIAHLIESELLPDHSVFVREQAEAIHDLRSLGLPEDQVQHILTPTFILAEEGTRISFMVGVNGRLSDGTNVLLTSTGPDEVISQITDSSIRAKDDFTNRRATRTVRVPEGVHDAITDYIRTHTLPYVLEVRCNRDVVDDKIKFTRFDSPKPTEEIADFLDLNEEARKVLPGVLERAGHAIIVAGPYGFVVWEQPRLHLIVEMRKDGGGESFQHLGLESAEEHLAKVISNRPSDEAESIELLVYSKSWTDLERLRLFEASHGKWVEQK